MKEIIEITSWYINITGTRIILKHITGYYIDDDELYILSLWTGWETIFWDKEDPLSNKWIQKVITLLDEHFNINVY